jgi:hypothetical protein
MYHDSERLDVNFPLENPEGIRPLKISVRIWENYVKTDECIVHDIYLAENKGLNSVMYLRVPQKKENVLTASPNISISKRTQIHKASY